MHESGLLLDFYTSLTPLISFLEFIFQLETNFGYLWNMGGGMWVTRS